jgi:hypothetical protein
LKTLLKEAAITLKENTNSRSKEYYAFLFEEFLLLTKEKKGKYWVKRCGKIQGAEILQRPELGDQ